jgi:hypothetical protein
VAYEAERTAKDERLIRLAARWANRLAAMRRPSESYSDVILRLVEVETQAR